MQQAQAAERKLLAEADAPRAAFVAPSRQKVGEYLADWLRRRREQRLESQDSLG